MKLEVRQRLSGAVLFTADIECNDSASKSVRIGLAVKSAVKTGANLVGADLQDAKGADLAVAKTRILPEGALIGWKKCAGDVLVKLRIPADAPRSHAFGRTCRAAFADCLEVVGADEGRSVWDDVETVYRAGERVTCHKWCDDWKQESAGGIHFFITREEAEKWTV